MLISVLVAALFFLPRAGVAALAGFLALLAGYEWARLCRQRPAWPYAVAVALVFVVLYVSGEEVQWMAFLVAGVFWLAVVPGWLWRGVTVGDLNFLLGAGFLVIAPAALAIVELPAEALLAVLVLVWIADIAAYFFGRAMGSRKLAPSISPGKTREGVAGGLLAALAYAIIYATFIEGVIWVPFLASATVLSVLSVVGDLFESATKRQANVKDSGALLPGHGGVLDRIDSATAALPVAVLLLPFAWSPS